MGDKNKPKKQSTTQKRGPSASPVCYIHQFPEYFDDDRDNDGESKDDEPDTDQTENPEP